MCVKRNIEGRSCNHCCNVNAITVTYSECVSVAFVIQHAKHIRRTAICGVSGSTIFCHLISKMERYSGKTY